MKNIVFTVMLSFLFSAPSFAEEQAEKIFPDSPTLARELVDFEARSEVTDVLESTVIKDKYANKYQKSTLQNLSTLYWLKGILDLENDKAIDNFVLINECEFFQKNIDNDFKWQKVRAAARTMIKENLSSYTDRYKIIVPIDLGRYDPERKGFPLVGETAFKELLRIEVGGNDFDVCGKKWEIPHYPRNAHLVLNKPFNYNFLALDEHLAQAYILRNNKDRPRPPKEVSTTKFNRIAFARVRLRLLEYQSTKRERNRTMVSVFFGKIDGVDVFEHADETGLLSSVDF